MKTRIGRLTALIILICAAVSVVQARRVLLPPPDGYKGVEIKGTKYVVGQVYIPQFADTTSLKEFGFFGFEALGSTPNYKKVKAIWPLFTDLQTLPEWISGLTYEKAKSVQEIEHAYSNRPKPDENMPECYYDVNGNLIYNYGYMNVAPPSSVYGDHNYRLRNYGAQGYRSYNGCDGSSGTWAPYWTWPHDYNPEAYRYRTTTRSKLSPTEIGAYPTNKALKRKNWGGGIVR
jgi:hypothetical protein